MLEIHNFTKNRIEKGLFLKVIEVVLKTLGIKDKIEISLAFVGDSRMRQLNGKYRGKNRVTDVLSFSGDDEPILPYLVNVSLRLKKGEVPPTGGKFINPPDGIKRLGEIIICYSQAKKQAGINSHSVKKEITVLLIHGMLHLVGYDHERGRKEEEEMKKMEILILTKV